MTAASGASAESVVALLEVIAAHVPEALELQLQVVSTSAMRSTLFELAHVFGVPPERLGEAVIDACRDLERLEKLRGSWRDPRKVLESPNVAALFYTCRARVGRVHRAGRRRRLEAILRKLKRANDHSRRRAWIEEFIGLRQPTSSRGHG